MVTIEWCKKKKGGIELIDPNENMSDSYLKMAEESIKALSNLKDSNIWTATTSYHIFYYSLYSLMLRTGIKCEIHSCSLEFMRECLTYLYQQEDVDMIKKAFSARINLQYYANRPVDKQDIDSVKTYCKTFFVKSKGILSRISEEEIESIRNAVKNM